MRRVTSKILGATIDEESKVAAAIEEPAAAIDALMNPRNAMQVRRLEVKGSRWANGCRGIR